MRKTRSRRWLQAGAALVLVALTAACGDDKDSTTSAGPDTTAAGSQSTAVPSPSVAVTTAPPAAVGTGACKYVTTAQASELAASPVKPGVNRSLPIGPVTFDYCDYIFDPGNSPGVTVAVADLAGNGPALFAQFRDGESSESDFQTVSGLGDEAFFAGTNLNVRKGNKGLILFVGRAEGFPRGADALPDERMLAELVLPQL